MNPVTWQGVIGWTLICFAFFVGSRWGRSRERFERQLRDQRRQARETNR